MGGWEALVELATAGGWGCGMVMLGRGPESWVHSALLWACRWASSPTREVGVAVSSALSRTVGKQDVLLKAVSG